METKNEFKIEKGILTNDWLLIRNGKLLTLFPTKKDALKHLKRLKQLKQ